MKKFFAVFIFIILACSFVFAGIGSPKIKGETENRLGVILKGTDNTALLETEGTDLSAGDSCEFRIYFAEGTTPLISQSIIAVGNKCSVSGVDVSSLEDGVYRLIVEKVGSSPPIFEDSYFAVVEIRAQPIPEIIPVFVILVVLGVIVIIARKGRI